MKSDSQRTRRWEQEFSKLSLEEKVQQTAIMLAIVAMIAPKLEARRQAHCDSVAAKLLADVETQP